MVNAKSDTAHRRIAALAALALVVPLSFLMKFYQGSGQWWVNNWGASVGYEMFFMLIAFIVYPRPEATKRIAIGVCVATCVLEFLQLWQPGWLQATRSTFVGRSILGDAFSWRDFPAYPLGCYLGWLLLRKISKITPVGGAAR